MSTATTTATTTATATATATALTHRDRAVLRAIRAGRCVLAGGSGVRLTVDGLGCTDQFVGRRLVAAGYLAEPGREPGPAQLTPIGLALLDAA